MEGFIYCTKKLKIYSVSNGEIPQFLDRVMKSEVTIDNISYWRKNGYIFNEERLEAKRSVRKLLLQPRNCKSLNQGSGSME